MDSISLQEFFKGDQMKIDVFRSKYLSHPEELVSDCFDRISKEIASVPLETESDAWANRWTNEFLGDEWRPGGSIIAGVNKKDKKISLFNCTHIPMKEDSLEGIYTCEYEVGKAAAFRQGIGIDFSKLRPRECKINNSAEISEGVVHWMQSMNWTGKRVGQRGRIPAMLFSVKISHPDVEEVITCKDKLEELQNANISIQITDDFMHAVFNDTDWTMTFTVESSGEVTTKVVRALDLFKKLCDHAWISGDPGVQFIDLMNNYSIQKALGYKISGSNACSEKPLAEYGVCGLASINMEKVPHLTIVDGKINYSDLAALKQWLEQKTISMVRFMDDVVEYELTHPYKSPLKAQYDIVKDLREIGIGVLNIHKWLYDMNLEYDSEEAILAVETFFRYYQYYTFKASCLLAAERGPCPAWTKAMNSFGSWNSPNDRVVLETEFQKNLFAEFPDLQELYYEHGIRNGALLSVAPTGTLPMTLSSDILSSGIEPTIGMYYWRRTRAVSKGEWDYYFVFPKVIKQLVLDKIKDKNSDDYLLIDLAGGSVLDNDGSKGEALVKIITKYLDPKTLKNAFQIDPFKKIELIGRVQRYVDAAISVTFNVCNSFTKEDVERLYIEGYKRGIKAMTIFREGSKEGIIFFEFPKHKPKETSVEPLHRPGDIEFVFAPKRPKKLPCEMHKVLGHWVIVGMLNGKPYEMFIIENGQKLPEAGFIMKAGNRTYRLLDANDSTVINNLIDNEIANDEIQAITRLTSSNLRHGVPIDFICEQLAKCGNSISSYPKMLGRVLKKYRFLVKDKQMTGECCPNCGDPLMRLDGCTSCVTCGFSKCSD